jgi:hypothetical protein
MPKRTRTPTRPFEQGVNPPDERGNRKRRKTQSKSNLPIQTGPRRGSHGAAKASELGLASPPATAPRRRRTSPIFEPEQSQSAALLRSDDSVVGGEDDDTEEEDLDLQGEENAVDELQEEAVDNVAEEDLYAPQLGDDGDPFIPDPFVNMRWRACFSDMEKSPIASAFNTVRSQRFFSVHEEDLWAWVDDTIRDQLPRRAVVSSLCAVVYSPKQNKRDRSIKTLRRDREVDWRSFQQLVVAVDEENNEPIHVDFDLILRDFLEEQPPRPSQRPLSQVSRARPVTATMFQEHGIDAALAAERAGSGYAIGIRDRWRCEAEHCSNYPYTCWLPPDKPERFEYHLPINGNTIARWARDITAQLATFDEPSDDVVLAIKRAKDRAEHEKAVRRRAGGEADDDLKSLTKLLVVGQLQQMGRAPLQGMKSASSILNTPQGVAERPPQWVPLEVVNHEHELIQHTENFFNWMVERQPLAAKELQDLCKKLMNDEGMDINMFMEEKNDVQTLWINHFKLPVGWYFALKGDALKWRNSYSGLTERNRRRIERYKKREELARQMLAFSSSSEVENDL